jgi:hypothetical protein
MEKAYSIEEEKKWNPCNFSMAKRIASVFIVDLCAKIIK